MMDRKTYYWACAVDKDPVAKCIRVASFGFPQRNMATAIWQAVQAFLQWERKQHQKCRMEVWKATRSQILRQTPQAIVLCLNT